jgi:hypothetical protein
MTIKVVEYVHEYDDVIKDWKTKEYRYTSRVRETYHAVGRKDEFNSTNEKGKWGEEDDSFTFRIGETDLEVWSRQSILGYIGLLTKLLEEFPEDD